MGVKLFKKNSLECSTYLPTRPAIVWNDEVDEQQQVVVLAVVVVGLWMRDPLDCQRIHAIEKYYDTRNVVARKKWARKKQILF